MWADTTASLPDRFLRVREVRRLWSTRIVQELYFPEHPTDEERAFSATAAYVAQFHPHGLAPVHRLRTSRILQALQADILDAESSVQGAMRTELQSIREERDRLRCELMDTRSELTDHIELRRELAQTRARVANQDREIARLSATLDRARAKKRKDTPLMPAHSQTPLTQVISPPIPADISTAHSGVPIGHLPPTAQTASNLVDSARFTALEGMVNQLATNMATNMTELIAMLRDQNRASSSFTPPPEHRPIVDPNPTVPLTFVSESKMLSYWDYEEFVIQTFQDSLTGSALDWFMTLKAGDVPTWTDLSQKFLDRYRFCVTADFGGLHPCVADFSGICTSRALCAALSSTAGLFPDPPTVIQSQPPQQHAPAQAQQGRPQASRSPQPTQRALTPRPQPSSDAQSRPRKQYTTLPALPSHIFRQFLAGNKIRTEVPSLHFDPSVHNQNLRCEFHQGALGHTVDTCWRLRDKIQEMINTRQISFNEVKPLNVRANPLPDHGSGSGPSVNMISIAVIEEEEDAQKTSITFVINYALAKVAFAAVLFVIEVLAKEPYQDSRVSWTYEGEVANADLEMSVMGITRSGRVYQGPEPVDKGKAPATAFSTVLEAVPLPTKKVTNQEAEAFMKVIKASEYKVVEQIGKSPTHILLLVLFLSSEPHRNALLKVLTAAQVPKDTAPDRIEETVNSIFSNQISLADDELPSEGQGHLQALHIVCKREVNGEIDLLIDVGPCPFSVTFQILEIPNAFNLLLGRPWIHPVGAVPSSLHQKLKFFVEGKLITVNGEEDYAVYKETAVPYISIGEDQNLPFHSFDTISVIQDYGEVSPSRTDRMIGKVLLKNNYVLGIGLGARAQGILRPIKLEEYRNKGDSVFAPPAMRSCRLVVESISTALLHITKSSPRAFQFHRSHTFFPQHH
ncbi:hypothetical protein CRG98_006372 [Punica granatum]|uniref:G-patch domain-containing protein n=1 Tax=Punica granatum TaxID=22663 RepID=A0A2I0KXQ5_PUNGR|nr:hypothetical protein CRG98_006372 [Punica granatum]